MGFYYVKRREWIDLWVRGIETNEIRELKHWKVSLFELSMQLTFVQPKLLLDD